jgi:hypothetical protein
MTCKNCKIERWDTHPEEHPDECCDCFDLGWFPEGYAQINAKRIAAGRPPLPDSLLQTR